MNELEEKIIHHQNLYYNDTPLISDGEFDKLWDQLKKEYPDSELLNSIGETIWDGWEKADHLMIMGSQDKFNNEEDFRNWVRVKKIKFPLATQYKLDGLSVELQYNKGILDKAVSRGNGVIGDNITSNVVKMKGVPKELKDKSFTGAVRGEILLDNKTFEKYFDNAKNPRNMASGITKRKSGVDSELLTVITYDVFSKEASFETEMEKLKFLYDNEFLPVETILFHDVENIIKYRDDISNKRNNNELNIAIDGLVLKQDVIVESDLLRKRPEYQRAFKFDTEFKVTKLIDIIWSRSGYNYTPVGILDPVDIAGSIVKRASLANLDNIEKLKVKIKDDVLIHKAGDIIPQIVKVVKEDNLRNAVSVPKKCEVCDTDLIITGARVFCPNLDCDGRSFHRLEKWLSKTKVKGFGPALLNHLFDNGFVNDIIDLYTLDLEDVLRSTNLKKATKKAFDNLYKIKELKLETFVSGFDIEGIGEGVVKFAVEAGYDTLKKLKEASIYDLMKVDGFSEGRSILLVEAMYTLYDRMVELSKYVKIKDNVKRESKLDKSFCFTGKLNTMKRSEAQDLVVNNGGTVKSGVSKGLDYLVNNDKESNSSKNKKAHSLNIKIITEDEFLEMLK